MVCRKIEREEKGGGIMAGKPAIFNREEVRQNQIVIPITKAEKERIRQAAKAEDRSMSSFVRYVLNEYFSVKEEG